MNKLQTLDDFNVLEQQHGGFIPEVDVQDVSDYTYICTYAGTKFYVPNIKGDFNIPYTNKLHNSISQQPTHSTHD